MRSPREPGQSRQGRTVRGGDVSRDHLELAPMIRTRARVIPLVGALVAALLVTSDAAAAVALPPAHAKFDYQIGGAYAPPSGVRVVSRDHDAQPASGLYNICYVNAFQAQPGTES